MRRATIVIGLTCGLLLWSNAPAYATAWSPWVYEISTWVNYPSWVADFCMRSGIVDTAVNRSEGEVHISPGRCGGTAKNVPSGYLAASVEGFRNGAYCGSSGDFYSNAPYYKWWVYQQMCSNPSGSQSFYTVAWAAIYDDGTGGGGAGYLWSSRSSPSQNY